MTRFVERHPAWALIVIIAVAVALWLIFAVWPPGLEEAVGRKPCHERTLPIDRDPLVGIALRTS